MNFGFCAIQSAIFLLCCVSQEILLPEMQTLLCLLLAVPWALHGSPECQLEVEAKISELAVLDFSIEVQLGSAGGKRRKINFIKGNNMEKTVEEVCQVRWFLHFQPPA